MVPIINKKKKSKQGILIVIIILVILIVLVGFFLIPTPLKGMVLDSSTYTKEQAVADFEKSKTVILSEKVALDGNALKQIINDSKDISLKDIGFFESKLASAEQEPNKEQKLFAVTYSSQVALLLSAIAVIRLGNINGSFTEKPVNIPTNYYIAQLDANVLEKNRINNVIAVRFDLNLDKVGEAKAYDNYSAAFMKNMLPYWKSYIENYAEYKRQAIIDDLAANKTIWALIESIELESLIQVYG